MIWGKQACTIGFGAPVDFQLGNVARDQISSDVSNRGKCKASEEDKAPGVRWHDGNMDFISVQ